MKETKMKPLMLLPTLAALLLLLSLSAARARQAVVPGRSVGRVFLGMQHDDVWKILQPPGRSRVVPSSALPAPHPPGRYMVDQWESGAHSVTILYRDAKVVQVEVNSPQFTAPGVVSVATPLAVVRRRFPRMRVDRYFSMGVIGGETLSGELVFYADDVRQGIAFTQCPDTATYDDLPRLKPDSLIVHLPGQQALPVVVAASHGVMKTEPRDKNDRLWEIRAWFAGGPLQKITKGIH